MESLLNRYRNITVLVLVILAQLVLVAVQVKNDRDIPMIRVWAVTAVTPLARSLESLRNGTAGFLNNYVMLRNADAENRMMRAELDKLKLENQFLKTELATAERAKALAVFQSRTPSKMLAARVIGMGIGSANSRVVFIDRGSGAGVMRGMGVVTPDGIIGKVLAAYPIASMVQLITDPEFAAGVVAEKSQIKGTLKGQGYATCKVDYVANEEKVEAGEMFYSSGDDRVFPKGFPAGLVRVVRPGTEFKEIIVEPVGLRHGLEEVLVLLEGMAQAIPSLQAAGNTPVYLAPAPPAAAPPVPKPVSDGASGPPGQTEADRLLERYRAIGAAQNHTYGVGLPGSKPPDFNLKLPASGVMPQATAPMAPQQSDRTETAGEAGGPAELTERPAPKPGGAVPGRPAPPKPSTAKPPAAGAPRTPGGNPTPDAKPKTNQPAAEGRP